VEDHTGSVEHAVERARRVAGQPLRGGGDDRFRSGFIVAGQQRAALLVEHGNDVRFDRLRPENGNEPRDARFVEYAVDGRGPAALRR
jgi:hypothetical protein